MPSHVYCETLFESTSFEDVFMAVLWSIPFRNAAHKNSSSTSNPKSLEIRKADWGGESAPARQNSDNSSQLHAPHFTLAIKLLV